MKSRIVLLGSPASGKGTQAAMITRYFDIPALSPGSVLRSEERAGTELGRRAALYTRHGQLAPDELVVAVVRSWLDRNDGAFVFDGFPRSLGQARSINRVLDERRTPIEIVFLLNASEQVICDRVGRRRVCEDCGNVVSLGFHITSDEAVCPECGGRLTRRGDDRAETLKARLAEYEMHTAPLIPLYEQGGVLTCMEAARPPEEVFESIRRRLE